MAAEIPYVRADATHAKLFWAWFSGESVRIILNCFDRPVTFKIQEY